MCVCFSPEVREFLGLDNKRNAAEPHDVDPSDQLDDSDVMVRPIVLVVVCLSCQSASLPSSVLLCCNVFALTLSDSMHYLCEGQC